MATGTLNYGSAIAMTVSLASLAPAGYCKTQAVENSASALDYYVGGYIQVAAATSIDGALEFYAYAAYEGSAYTAGLTSTATSITWGTTGQTGVDGYQDLPYLGRAAVDATDGSDFKRFGPFSVASAFGGILPRRWGLVFRNNQTTPTFNANGLVYMTPVKVDIT